MTENITVIYRIACNEVLFILKIKEICKLKISYILYIQNNYTFLIQMIYINILINFYSYVLNAHFLNIYNIF